MKQLVALIVLAFGISHVSHAQTFLDRLQAKKQGQGKVTVIQSTAIDELVNGKNTATVSQKPKSNHADTPKTQTEKPHATERNDGNKTVKTQSEKDKNTQKTEQKETVGTQNNKHTEPDNTAETETTPVPLRKKVMRQGYKVDGYRVQAFSGGNSRADRQKAENIGAAIKAHFPEEPVYVHFYSPRWICRVGNYRSYEEANRVLQQIQKLGYKQACIVKGKITVQY